VVGAENQDELCSVCDDPAASRRSICEFRIPREKPKLLLSESEAIFYPTKLSQRTAELAFIYPVAIQTAANLKLTVLDKDSQKWKTTMITAYRWSE
jgi:hypothetical protein